VAAAGGDAGGQLDLLERLDDAWNRLQLGSERIADGGVQVLLPLGWQGPPQSLGEDPQRRRHAQAEEVVDAVLIARLQAKRRDPLRLDSKRDPVAVDEDAIAVEDHQLRRDRLAPARTHAWEFKQ
jgi:hypothetical protein